MNNALSVTPLTWSCVQCHSKVMVEVSSNSFINTRIEGISGDDKLIFGDHVDVVTGKPDHYECAACGQVVRDGPVIIQNRRDLVSYLTRGK